MDNSDGKLQEPKAESDSPQNPNPEENVESKSDETHISEAAHSQTKLEDGDLVQEEIRKSPGEHISRTDVAGIDSGGKVKQKEASKGSDKTKGRTTPPAREPEVVWRHTAAAENTVRAMEKAAELERRLKTRTSDAGKKLVQHTINVGKMIGTASKGIPKIPKIPKILVAAASSQFFDAQTELDKPINESKLSPKRAEKRIRTSTKPKVQSDSGKKAKQQGIIPKRAEKKSDSHTKLKIQSDSDKKEQGIPSHGETPKKLVVDPGRKPTPPDDAPEKRKSTVEPQSSKSKREKVKGDLNRGQGQTEVAVISIEKEILNRTDPDLEEAIRESIFFSYKITEPGVPPDDLAAYIQKIREEEAEELASEEAAEAAAEEREKEAGLVFGLIRKETDVSIALSTDSAEERERIRRKQLRWSERMLEMVDDAFSASVKSKHCMEIFRCASSIRKEKERQRRVNRFIVHPYSNFRIGWDIMVVIALILTMVTLPVEIAFFSEHKGVPTKDSYGNVTDDHPQGVIIHEEQVYEGLNAFAEVIFIIDIVINFRTGYVFRELDQVILSNKAIVWHYLRTWFIFDFISAVPFDKLYEWSSGHDKDPGQYLRIRFLRMAKILALLRAFQVFRLLRYIHSLETIFLLQENIVEICNLIGATLLFAHWNGCLQYMACFTEHYPDFPPDSWIAKDDLQWPNVTMTRRYTRSLVRALSHMLAVGYAQSPPTATSETWIVVVSMLVGCTFYALFIAYMATLIRSLDYSGAQYNQEVDSMREFLRSHKTPTGVQHRILRFLEQKYRHKFFDSDVYFKTSILSPSIQKSLSMHSCRRMVKNVSFFKNASMNFIYAIVKRLEFQVFYPGELILRAGAKTQCLLLVAHGKVEVYSKAVLLEKIFDGGYYGEVSLMLHTSQPFDVIAADVSDIYLLTKEGFDEVLAEFPEIRDSLREIGAVHIEREQTRIELLKRDDLSHKSLKDFM